MVFGHIFFAPRSHFVKAIAKKKRRRYEGNMKKTLSEQMGKSSPQINSLLPGLPTLYRVHCKAAVSYRVGNPLPIALFADRQVSAII
jgi:hypothetical protein